MAPLLLIVSTKSFQLTKNDNLATNICKHCAIEILKSYKFRLKYLESEGKLHKMLGESKDEPHDYQNMFNVEVNIDETGSTLDTTVVAVAPESRWKCVPCAATFATRDQYYGHRRLHHPRVAWRCAQCPAAFRTKKLKSRHEAELHPPAVDVTNSKVKPTDESSIVIHDDDSDTDDLLFPTITEVNVEVDENAFGNQEPDELDLGLYMLEKHNQISGFDPLDVNHSNSAALNPIVPILRVKTADDINNKWKCRTCSGRFRTRDLLREHNHMHMEEKRSQKLILKPIPKPIQTSTPKPILTSAPKPTTTPAKTIEKVKVVHDNASNKKPLVDKVTNNPTTRWQCKTCSQFYETRELLRIHRRTYFAKKESSTEVKPGQKKEESGDVNVGVMQRTEEVKAYPEVRKVYPGAKKRKIEPESC